MTARFPHSDGFLAGEIEVDAAASASMQSLDERARRAMVAAVTEDMTSALRDVTREDHVVIEFHANILRAWP